MKKKLSRIESLVACGLMHWTLQRGESTCIHSYYVMQSQKQQCGCAGKRVILWIILQDAPVRPQFSLISKSLYLSISVHYTAAVSLK